MPTQILLLVPGPAGGARQALLLGLLAGAGSVAALVVQPLAGLASDRSTGRHGRRRPMIVAGAAASLAGMALLAAPLGLAVFATGFVLLMLGSNACTAAYQALLPDRVPTDQRGEASGYMGAMTIVGSVGSLVAAPIFLAGAAARSTPDVIVPGAARFYLAAGAAMVAGILVTIFAVPETPLRASASRPRSRGAWLRQLWPGPWGAHGFRWVFVARALVMFGFSLFLTFVEYYFAQVHGSTDFVGATAYVALLALAGAVVSALVLGVFSDRVARVPVVVVSSALMATAALAFVVAPVTLPLGPLGLLFGVGYGGYMSVDWALAIDTLPSAGTAATDLGLWNIASAFPAAVAPLVGGMVVALGEAVRDAASGYRLVFGLAAVSLVLGSFAVLRIREESLPRSAVRTPGAQTEGLGPRSSTRP